MPSCAARFRPARQGWRERQRNHLQIIATTAPTAPAVPNAVQTAPTLPQPSQPLPAATCTATDNSLTASELSIFATHIVPFAEAGNVAASAVVLIIEEELARWKAGRPSLVRAKNAKPSKADSLLFRAAAKDPDSVCKTLRAFFRVALGGAPGVTHDAACRALTLLVHGGLHKKDGQTKQLLNSLVPSLHAGEAASTLPSTLRRAIHEVFWQDNDQLVFAVPSLTRHGAAVLQTPAHVLQLLRTAYFESLAKAKGEGGDAMDSMHLTCDPTSVRREGQGESIIVGGGAKPAAHVTVLKRGLVEWAVVPECLHDTILEQMRPLCEAWCGQQLVPVRFFGVRRYYRGSLLQSHIDSDPSCRAIGVSITVDVEGLEAPWPLKAHAVHPGEPTAAAALPVGQCFAYEASRVRHQRDQPLNGRVFANCFCHYTVKGWQKEGFTPSADIGRATLMQVREACRGGDPFAI